MRILITGSQGYVGSALVAYISENCKSFKLDGLDLGLFQNLTHFSIENNDFRLNNLKFIDLRDVNTEDLENYDAVVHLAAVSNDPIGEKYSKITDEINFKSTIDFAKKIKKVGIKKFIFASSASVYGFAEDVCTENSPLNPLTSYAKSKANSEVELKKLSDKNFQVTCLRFSTAAGWSTRLRSNIALNNFVIQAVLNKKIKLNSKGNAFRPFVDVQEVAKAILFCLSEERNLNQDFEVYNIGQNSWNFKIIDLAKIISQKIEGTSLIINPNELSDSRSYILNFDKYNDVAGEFNITSSIHDTISNLENQIIKIKELKPDEFFSRIVRLQSIERLVEKRIIHSDLRFT